MRHHVHQTRKALHAERLARDILEHIRLEPPGR
jgi:hypothetical protein